MSRSIPTYDECYAFILLGKFGLNNCQLSDKPDIISNDKTWGIEIVSALFEDEHKLETYFHKKIEGKDFPLPNGYESFGYGIVGPSLGEHKLLPEDRTIEESIKIAIDMIRKKKEKVVNYSVEAISLYITNDLCYNDDDRLKEIAIRMYTEAKDTFQSIYINVRDANKLIVCFKDNVLIYDYHEYGYDIANEAKALQNSYKESINKD